MTHGTGARVLSICSSQDEQQEILRMLESAGTGVPRRPPFEVTTAGSVAAAIELLQSHPFDVALLSIMPSVPEALGSVCELREHYASLPVVLVLDEDDEKLAVEAASRGVQDCIVRGEMVGNLLARSLQYAVERQELQTELERRSVVDEMTGLYNRRGFFAVGEQEWRRARRRGDGFLLVFADLDGLKTANDRDGHEAGDALIKAAAALLAAVFRDTDILARLGGDEFAVIAHQTGQGGAEVIRQRLDREIEKHNTAGGPGCPLSLSVGIAAFAPREQAEVSLDDLLSRADGLMYEEKQRRKKARQ